MKKKKVKPITLKFGGKKKPYTKIILQFSETRVVHAIFFFLRRVYLSTFDKSWPSGQLENMFIANTQRIGRTAYRSVMKMLVCHGKFLRMQQVGRSRIIFLTKVWIDKFKKYEEKEK